MCDMSDSINELAAALSKAQSCLTHAKKDSKNPFFKSSYADLTSIVEAIKKPLSENGLAYSQLAESSEGLVKITTILMHSSGQWIRGTLHLAPVKNDPQSYGSAVTYGRRYGLQAIVGLSADEDDDGNAATGNAPPKQPQKPPAPKPDPKPNPKTSPKSEDPFSDANKKPGINYKFLETMKTVKAQIVELDGSDAAYYQCLGTHGAEKSNEIMDDDLQKQVYKDLMSYIKNKAKKQKTVKCPDMEDAEMPVEDCAVCAHREGCKAHEV